MTEPPAVEAEPREALTFLERRGYRRCDIMACNCNSWHGGHAEQRLGEIEDALTDAGIEMNGKTILQGVLDALSSQPGAAPTWQTIETAPTNGEPILVAFGHRRHKHRTIATFNRVASLWYSCCGAYHGAPMMQQPTHWMPIPQWSPAPLPPPVDSVSASCAETWQPIETAPQDGRMILVFPSSTWTEDTEGDYEVTYWDAQADYIAGQFVGAWHRWCSPDDYAGPTHWMPLPLPPSCAETAGTEQS